MKTKLNDSYRCGACCSGLLWKGKRLSNLPKERLISGSNNITGSRFSLLSQVVGRMVQFDSCISSKPFRA